jgi:hypothetical protein
MPMIGVCLSSALRHIIVNPCRFVAKIQPDKPASGSDSRPLHNKCKKLANDKNLLP